MKSINKSDYKWGIPLVLSGAILLAQAFPLPPVYDLGREAWVSGFRMRFPFWHLLFSPLCGLADLLTIQSVWEDIMLLLWLIIAGAILLRRWQSRVFYAIAVLLFVIWAELIPRPMGRLEPANPNILLIDFHSHTSWSHDGTPWFKPEKNMEWHRQQGYGAAFITDHNRIEGTQEAKQLSRLHWRETGYRSLEGEEVSLKKTALIVFPTRERIDNDLYDSNLGKIPLFISDMRRQNRLAIVPLPDYWRNDWGREGVRNLVHWGIAGFEIMDNSPIALDFPAAYRREIVNLCRTQNLPVMAASNNHGWGYATAGWNAMGLPGWRNLNPDQTEDAVIRILRERGFQAIQVLARAKFFRENQLQLIFCPMVNLWVYWRTLQSAQVLSWIGWIWLIAGTRYLYYANIT